jgi:6-pyruvoyltetrahydropterin/6-carboxytetrahydropterin synthase
MSLVFVTRREQFNAAHRMFRAEWNDEKNLQVFGKCSNPNWHGHNYTLFVTVKGKINPETGYVIDLSELGRIIKTEVIEKLDHKNINIEVDFMQNRIVSAENLAVAIWNELEPSIKSMEVELHCVKIVETENNYIEYYGQ